MMAKPKSERPYRVLFVCTGNTCRSPMAEGILKKLLDEDSSGHPPIDVESAGVAMLSGLPASEWSVKVCAEHGIDISNHRSQAANTALLKAMDLVMALDTGHYDFCLEAGVPADRLFLLRAFPDPPPNWRQLSVPDPIGSPREVYEQVFLRIDESLRAGVSDILRRARVAAGKGDRS